MSVLYRVPCSLELPGGGGAARHRCADQVPCLNCRRRVPARLASSDCTPRQRNSARCWLWTALFLDFNTGRWGRTSTNLYSFYFRLLGKDKGLLGVCVWRPLLSGYCLAEDSLPLCCGLLDCCIAVTLLWALGLSCVYIILLAGTLRWVEYCYLGALRLRQSWSKGGLCLASNEVPITSVLCHSLVLMSW